MLHTIIIPTYNHLEDCLQPCLQSIRDNTPLDNVSVIVVANGCTDDTQEYIFSLQLDPKWAGHLHIVSSLEPLGYPKAINLGLSNLSKDTQFVTLLNNDTIVYPGWFPLLLRPFLYNEKAGITGPVKFNFACGAQRYDAMGFWCVMIRRSLFDLLGPLDEVFSPGMGEDADFSIKVTQAGYRLISVPEDCSPAFEAGIVNTSFPIYHKGNGTFADDIKLKEDVIERNNKILEERYSMIAHLAETIRPIVSIVIPTYNHFNDALKPCLEAVCQYTDFNDKEIIVVANGCTDDTHAYLDVLEKIHKQITSIRIPEPCGPIVAMNAGLARATAPYVIFLDNDAFLLPQNVDDWIRILLRPFMEQPRVGITGPFAHEYENLGFVIHGGCAAYDKQLLTSLGGFDEAYNPGYFCDPDICMRIANAGYQCIEVPVHRAEKPYNNGIFSINFPVMHLGNVQTMNKNTDIDLVKRNREKLYAQHAHILDITYRGACQHPGDIYEHLPTLRRLASKCDHVTEFGVRGGISTWALLTGRPKHYRGYDIVYNATLEQHREVAPAANIDFQYHIQDVLQASIEETDLLFIDTWHTYDQLTAELKRHSHKVRQYLVFHDTVSYGMVDEQPFDKTPGVPSATGKAGLRAAITEFLDNNHRWQILEEYDNNNGLMILQRRTDVDISIVIPTYNHLDDCLRPCLESIFRNTHMSGIEIIVVANGCTDGTRDYMREVALRYPGMITLVWREEALGYTISTNLGIRQARGKYIMLLNNDTEIQDYAPKHEWIQRIMAPFHADPLMRMTGPLQLKDFYSNVQFIVFFCALIESKMFEELGLLDEVYAPGAGEDIDYAWKIQNAGYKIMQCDVTTYNGHTNVGTYPMWHKDNRTFGELPVYTQVIVKRNGLLNLQRYNKNLKLNVGSGGIEVPGYVSVDLYDKRANIIHDITKLSEIIPPGITDEILAVHVFEHLNPYKSIDILSDWYNTLKPGGKLVMEMPNLEELCKKFATATLAERYNITNAIYGSVNTIDPETNPGAITAPHLFGWWPESLYAHLAGVGFQNIQFMAEQFPHPADNLRVEATRPL